MEKRDEDGRADSGMEIPDDDSIVVMRVGEITYSVLVSRQERLDEPTDGVEDGLKE